MAVYTWINGETFSQHFGPQNCQIFFDSEVWSKKLYQKHAVFFVVIVFLFAEFSSKTVICCPLFERLPENVLHGRLS